MIGLSLTEMLFAAATSVSCVMAASLMPSPTGTSWREAGCNVIHPGLLHSKVVNGGAVTFLLQMPYSQESTYVNPL